MSLKDRHALLVACSLRRCAACLLSLGVACAGQAADDRLASLVSAYAQEVRSGRDASLSSRQYFQSWIDRLESGLESAHESTPSSVVAARALLVSLYNGTGRAEQAYRLAAILARDADDEATQVFYTIECAEIASMAVASEADAVWLARARESVRRAMDSVDGRIQDEPQWGAGIRLKLGHALLQCALAHERAADWREAALLYRSLAVRLDTQPADDDAPSSTLGLTRPMALVRAMIAERRVGLFEAVAAERWREVRGVLGPQESIVPHVELVLETAPEDEAPRILGRVIMALQGVVSAEERLALHLLAVQSSSDCAGRVAHYDAIVILRTAGVIAWGGYDSKLDDAQLYLGRAKCLLSFGMNEEAIRVLDEGLRRLGMDHPMAPSLTTLRDRARAAPAPSRSSADHR